MNTTAPLILTLQLDERSFAFFDEQRRRYFPPERNFIPAHLTLFHALPGEQLGTIAADLEALSKEQVPHLLEVTGLRFLGRGVAYRLDSPSLILMRQILAERWASWLTVQDRQKLQPHVTVQNKVEPETARWLQKKLEIEFDPFVATGVAIDIWRYLGGPWEKIATLPFSANLPVS